MQQPSYSHLAAAAAAAAAASASSSSGSSSYPPSSAYRPPSYPSNNAPSPSSYPPTQTPNPDSPASGSGAGTPQPSSSLAGAQQPQVQVQKASRLNAFEDRLASLEAASSSSALTTRNALAPPPSPQTIADHERRIAHLEAQIYALQLSASASQQQQQQGRLSPHAIRPAQPQPPNGYAFPAQPQQPYASTSGSSEYAHLQQPPYPSPSPYPSSPVPSNGVPHPSHNPFPTSLRTSQSSYEVPEWMGTGPTGAGPSTFGVKREASSTVDGEDGGVGPEGGGGKRWKVLPKGVEDFVKRGEVGEEEARTAFESYTYVKHQHGGYAIPAEVVRHQMETLENSDACRQPTDRVLRVSLEQCFVSERVFKKLGPGMTVAKRPLEEVAEIVKGAIEELLDWSKKWLDVMELLTLWGDNPDLKAAVPFHHARLNLLMYIFKEISDESARNLPNIAEFSRMARDSSLIILQWGVESSIWAPSSMFASYLHYANIPTALQALYTATRLFPSNANFSLIRRLLHRVLKSCESVISNSTSDRELARARATKELVVEFDRYAFEESAVRGEGGVVGGESEVEPDVPSSLQALSGELNLFGVIVLDALEDVE
ncbi:Zn(2)-C6 fungal-type transcription factor [Pseudohyphozyma bogoriensis]|nr:Zn(2)-C6 fungal-type transcription factor [Pseudohyphozyma bogoriensis]